jgi:PAS domain S-box-containing protein
MTDAARPGPAPDGPEQALRLVPSAEQFALLVSSVVDYAIFLLDADGRVASWNPGAQRLKGYRADEILGRHFSCFYDEEAQRAGRPEQLLRTARAEGRVEDEAWRVRKDGSRFWADVVITALRGPDGSVQGYAKVTRDVTARKEYEDSLRENEAKARETAEQLRRLDQMKNEFVAMVAHDLSSPLTVVAGFAELLLEQWDVFGDADKRDMLARIQRTAVDLATLVSDILAVGRIEAGELEIDEAPFDLAALVRRAAVDAAPPTAPDRIRVSVPPDVPMALGDERRTWQVLMNLVSNGLKFSAGDSPVDLSLAVTEGELVVRVWDHGTGIAPEDRSRVFDRFVRLSRPEGSNQRGSGLGLYISKALVEAQGGRIWIDNGADSGAVFCFSLPVASGEVGEG